MVKPLRHWPWLTVHIIVANVAIVVGLAALWYSVFMQQSTVYSERLMSTFNIEPGQLHAMYVDDVERQLWTSVLIGIVAATVASIGLALLIVRPLRSLSRATERLRHGDYGIRSPINQGEVGYLAGNINALAAALEQEEHRRVQYMADLSHELRTPITNLRGYTEGLEDGVVPADRRFFKLMAGELSHLTALTRTIDGMQLDSERDESSDTVLPIGDFLQEAMVRWAPRFDKRGLSLELRVAGNVANRHIGMPVNSLRQVVDNLLSNIVRYAAPTGACALHATTDGQGHTVTLTFRNHAPDVDEAALPFLFDRFYRISESRTRAHGEVASGLGLAIVKQLCLANGGHVNAFLSDRDLSIVLALPLKAC